MSKFIVDKKDFCSNFLGTIVSFKEKMDFIPIHFIGGKLVYFSNLIMDSGSVFIFCEHTPESCDMEDGSVFYISSPQKIKKMVESFEGERVAFGVTGDQLISKSKNSNFRLKLYDANLAERNRDFMKPEKFHEIKDEFKGGVTVSKETLKQIKVACSTFEDKKATLNNVDGLKLTVGEDKTNSFEINLVDDADFGDSVSFCKHLFMVLNNGDFHLCENETGKIICVREEVSDTTKYFFTTKFRA